MVGFFWHWMQSLQQYLGSAKRRLLNRDGGDYLSSLAKPGISKMREAKTLIASTLRRPGPKAPSCHCSPQILLAIGNAVIQLGDLGLTVSAEFLNDNIFHHRILHRQTLSQRREHLPASPQTRRQQQQVPIASVINHHVLSAQVSDDFSATVPPIPGERLNRALTIPRSTVGCPSFLYQPAHRPSSSFSSSSAPTFSTAHASIARFCSSYSS